jgi:nucleoid-associated protein YgaU
VSRRTKFILVAIVIVVGFGLAWQFRKRGPSLVDTERTTPFAAPSRLAPADLSVNSAASPAPAGQAESSAPFVTRPTSAAPASPSSAAANWQPPAQTSAASIENSAVRPKQGVADDGGVPELSTAFTGGRDAKGPSPIGGDGPSIDSSPRLESSIDSGLGPSHKVADGDTLTQLAQHYLGSADRWRELYEFNRDVLADPELLPIGAELRIPTAPFPVAQEVPPAATQQPLARNVSQPINAPENRRGLSPFVESSEQKGTVPLPADGFQEGRQSEASLAPVTSVPPAGNAAPAPTDPPSARLQRLPPVVGPVARALRVAPRTYVVQSGDTLNSIAEKLYGDGRHEDLLREANRNLLQSGQPLQPGTVLVVPLGERH